ncbi:MAG: UvrD-helicase domain-containing protein [Gammaproteobacteria bacterium]|jgi:ATP-dependent helicase/nuclease subunit A|nr:UvrD-helicase domain-containing protein [Gammaproteobacteria bacterium]
MTDHTLIDEMERQQALDINESFCVQAPAGSGKTELLIQRFLKLLVISDEPEDVLAITFTRKAAFEMRQRLLINLRQENKEELSSLTNELVEQTLERNNLRQWHLLENPQRLQIKTIDAFNASICAQLPIVSGLGGQVDIVEDMEAIYQQAIETSLAKLNDDSALSSSIAIFLTHLDNNLARAKNLLTSLLDKREQWLSHILRIQHEELRNELSLNLQQVITEALESASYLFKPFSKETAVLVKFADENLTLRKDNSLVELATHEHLPSIEIKDAKAWSALANLFLTKEGSFRKTISITNGFPSKSSGSSTEEKELFECKKNDYQSLLNNIKESPVSLSSLQNLLLLPAPNYSDNEWDFLEALTKVLLDLVSELNLLLNQSNQADYIHMSASALQALNYEANLSDISLRLDYRIKHILVDEFQDTSLQQIELLKRLTAEWQDGDGRTLFIVGDGMQSCYSFRNADVGLFLKTRDEGIGNINLNSLQLKMNFRSTTSIVDWVNQVFSKSFPQQDSISHGAVSYSSSKAVKTNDDSGVSTTFLVDRNEEKTELALSRKAEALLLLKQLEKLLLKPNISIAILVRNRSHLDAIVPLLRQAEISWNASDINSLSAVTAIIDLLSLYRALSNLADKTALLSLLRTPFIGLALTDIHELTLYSLEQEVSLWQSLTNFHSQQKLSADAQQRLQRVMPILQHARELRLTLSVRAWLEQCWINLGAPESLQNSHELQYIERFFLLLETETLNGEIRDIHAFERKCNRTYLGTTHNTSTSLQIMTIHKAKGLEFDYVFIPGLDRKPRSNDKELFLWHEHNSAASEGKLLLAPLNALGEGNNPTYQYLKSEAGLRSKLENTRLIYIALTRAKQRAFLFATVKADKSSALKAPTKNSLLSTIWSALEQDESLVSSVDLTIPAKTIKEKSSKTTYIRRLKSNWTKHSYLNSEPVITDFKKNEESDQHLIEKKVGELIHEFLRLKIENNTASLEPLLQNKYEAFWRSSLKPVCSVEQTLEDAVQTINDNLNSCMAHEKAQWLFDNTHEASATELAISDYRQQWRKEHIVDRTFIDDGVRWIIDYKSTRMLKNQSKAEFLSQQEDHYRPQLERYAELFQAMEDLPIRTALFFTSMPYWHEIDL